MKQIILPILIAMFLTSCTTELDKRIQKVSYGTSFGECMGYCKHQMVISRDSVKYSCISNGNILPQKDVYKKMTFIGWDSLRNNITVSSLLALPEVIGCPDCADGGAEWLELMLANGETHKVTFEYGKEPVSIKDYIAKCRLILNGNTCQ